MNEKQKKGLTYGRLMLLMLALILLAVGAAWIRQLSLGPAIGFDDIAFEAVLNADYSVTEANSTLLEERENITRKDNGALLFIKTNTGSYAKLSVVFKPCLIDSANNKFQILQGVVYDSNGELLNNFGYKCVDLNQQFDLDSWLMVSEGAPEGTPDIEFLSQGPAFNVVKTLDGVFIALPTQEEIQPAE